MKIDIIGRGNVAHHLCKAFHGIADVLMVNPRTFEELREESDFFLICVSDDAIGEMSERLPLVKGIVAHTSGATSLFALNPKHSRRGVFYPLQTFSKDIELNYSNIPFIIEGVNENTANELFSLAQKISKDVRHGDSETRRKIHIASVFACNFTNHLWALADEYLQKEDLDFGLLKPLIAETVRKMGTGHPRDMQTGPAVRRDTQTIERHLESLEPYPDMQNIYWTLTESIIHNQKIH